MDIFGFCVDEFKTFGEATLPKELTLVISANANITVRLFELFLDDRVLGGCLRSRACGTRDMMVHNCDIVCLLDELTVCTYFLLMLCLD